MDPENCNREFLKQNCTFDGYKYNLNQPQADFRTLVSDSSKYPLSCIGMIIADFDYYDEKKKQKLSPARGTGFLIGPNLVLTAAHNLFHPVYGDYKKVHFYPAINKEDDLENAVQVHIEDIEWDKNYKVTWGCQHDLALLKLTERIGEKHGYLGVDFSSQNILLEEQLMMYGYSRRPKNAKEFKYEMLESPGICTQVDKNFIHYKEKTNKGQSGGPIIEQKSGKFFAVGVHLGGYKDHQDHQHIQSLANHLTQKKLQLIKEWIRKFDVKDFHNFQQYKIIDLSWQNPDNTLEFFTSLKENELQQVKQIIFKCCGLNSKDFQKLRMALKQYNQATKIDLSFNKITKEGIKYLRSLFPKVKNLDLCKNRLNDQVVKEVIDQNFQQVEILDLRLNQLGDDQGFKQLYKLTKLKILKISEIGISSNGLSNMNFGKDLRTIHLSGNNIGKNTLYILVKWEQQLRQIDASDNNITDEGLKLEGKVFPYLKKLDLSNNELTDNCSEYFPAFNLKWLHLMENQKLTDDGLKKIGARLGLRKIWAKILC